MRPSWSGSRTATAGLLVANAVPLAGVVGLGWDLHSLLVVYWLESAVVGAASVAKIRRAEGEDDPGDLPSFSLNDRSVRSFVGRSNRRVAGFFAGHYGAFWAVHGVFVLLFPFMFDGVEVASPDAVGAAGVGLVAYHAVSYRINYLGAREYAHSGPVTLMVEPYRRVFVLHATILLGAVAVAAVGVPAGALAVMVLVKTVLDLWGHWAEHDRARRREASPTPAE